MKLDARIKNREDIFDCFNSDKAEKYIYKRGYFSNYLGDFSDLVNNRPKNGTLEFGTLGKIHNDLDSPYYMKENVSVYAFFFPLCLVEDKKYSRPFSIIEFKSNLPNMIFPDDLIHFRNNKNGYEEYALRYNGYIIDGKTAFICLGSRDYYSLENLFKSFEYLDKNGEWNMFGVCGEE